MLSLFGANIRACRSQGLRRWARPLGGNEPIVVGRNAGDALQFFLAPHAHTAFGLRPAVPVVARSAAEPQDVRPFRAISSERTVPGGAY